MTLLDNLHIAKKNELINFSNSSCWLVKVFMKSLENLVVFQLDAENYATKISVRPGVNVE